MLHLLAFISLWIASLSQTTSPNPCAHHNVQECDSGLHDPCDTGNSGKICRMLDNTNCYTCQERTTAHPDPCATKTICNGVSNICSSSQDCLPDSDACYVCHDRATASSPGTTARDEPYPTQRLLMMDYVVNEQIIIHLLDSI